MLDTDGNGKRDAAVEPDQPVDPQKDKRLTGGFYAINAGPGGRFGMGHRRAFAGKGAVVRLDPGPNPPATALAEVYNVPLPSFGPRGADIDSKGVVWVSLGSGHLGSFDRRKCKGPLNGPKATGDHCPEGWTLYQYPGPGFDGIGNNSAEASYYTWVDRHNTLGLGNDVPISTGNENDAALVEGKSVVLRVPSPAELLRQGHGPSTTPMRDGKDAVDEGRRQGPPFRLSSISSYAPTRSPIDGTSPPVPPGITKSATTSSP